MILRKKKSKHGTNTSTLRGIKAGQAHGRISVELGKNLFWLNYKFPSCGKRSFQAVERQNNLTIFNAHLLANKIRNISDHKSEPRGREDPRQKKKKSWTDSEEGRCRPYVGVIIQYALNILRL